MSSTPSRPIVLACSGLLAAVALLSGCGGGDQAAATPSTTGSASVPPADPSTTPPTVPPPASSSAVPATSAPVASRSATPTAGAAPAGPASCPAARLGVTVRPDAGGGAAGSVYESIVFVNQGSTSCTLDGHPGVSYVVGSGGAQVGAPAGRDGVPAPVTLLPGGTAHASLRVVDYQNVDRETCQSSPVAGLRVYPPDSTASVFVAAPGSTCADPSVLLLTVGPVQEGAGG